MPNTIQEFFADATEKAAVDLEAAYLKLPADKRQWNPAPKARSAADQVAECVLLNTNSATLLHARVFDPKFDMAAFVKKQTEIMQNEEALLPALRESAAQAVAAIRAVPDSDLSVEVPMPWGAMSLTRIIAYPYWNMGYHEGQITYIASLLETAGE